MMERDNQEAEAEKLQEWETRRRRQEYGFDNRSCFVMVALLAVLVLAFMAFQYSLDYRTGHKEIQESEEREGTAKIGPITANP
jgi:ferric-dicitrate binding protein FerR (iron transport regulator)